MTVRDILRAGAPPAGKKKSITELENIGKTACVLAAATGCSLLLDLAFGVGNESIIMVFLLGVLFSVILTASSAYGIAVSILSLILFDYFFAEPRFTFHITLSRDLTLLAFFMVTAVVSGIVTSRLQTQIQLTASNEKTARTLYQIALGFLPVNGEDRLVDLAKTYGKDNTGCDCQVFLGVEPPNPGSPLFTDYPVNTPEGKIGVLRAFPASGGDGYGDDMILTAIASQLGVAVYRERLRSKQEDIRLAMEREQQRSMLLRSVAHDLRSPLTALYGTGSLLADDYALLDDAKRRALAANMSEEILWLTGLVENILNMTRIGEGQLVLSRDREAVDDLFTNAVSHVRRLLKGRDFKMSLPDEVVLVPADGKLIVQVIVNLLENAVKHTPPDAAICLAAAVKDGAVEISVSDTGDGIAPEMKARIFDRFVMLDNGVIDGKQGLGLGLAICKAIVDAHGGSIRVEDNEPHGARFVFSLPLEVK